MFRAGKIFYNVKSKNDYIKKNYNIGGFVIPTFSWENEYFNFMPKSVRRPSVRTPELTLVGYFKFPKVLKVKGQIIYFLVDASPPKPLDVATSSFVPE